MYRPASGKPKASFGSLGEKLHTAIFGDSKIEKHRRGFAKYGGNAHSGWLFFGCAFTVIGLPNFDEKVE
jgi:hypothetical protein